MSERGLTSTEEWSGARDTYYWYAKTEARESYSRDAYYWYAKTETSSNDLADLCEWAVEDASSAKDLAHAATLVVGAGMLARFGPRLESKIAEHVRIVNGRRNHADALVEARWIGEALSTLRHDRPADR